MIFGEPPKKSMLDSILEVLLELPRLIFGQIQWETPTWIPWVRRQTAKSLDFVLDNEPRVMDLQAPAQGRVADDSLEAHIAAGVEHVFWFDGTALIAKTEAARGAISWTPSQDGIHLIRVIDDHGRVAEREAPVQFTN